MAVRRRRGDRRGKQMVAARQGLVSLGVAQGLARSAALGVPVRHSDKTRRLARRQVDAGAAQARFEQRNADSGIAGLALFHACAGTYRLRILALLVRLSEEAGILVGERRAVS